jgi:hypothetical protein
MSAKIRNPGDMAVAPIPHQHQHPGLLAELVSVLSEKILYLLNSIEFLI